MIKQILIILLFAVTALPAAAQNIDDFEGTIEENPDPPDLYQLIDYNKSNNTINGLSPHKANYILPVTYSFSDTGDGRKNYETKFQMSLKQRLIKFYGWAFYFAYSQKSFWQVYDMAKSRPFRENNFNPELFLRTKMWRGFRIDTGLEHESNGRELPDSRSWNRVCITPYFENDYVIASLKSWYRFREKRKENENDVNGDDNYDILRYYGYGELGLTLKFSELRNTYLSFMGRCNPRHKRGAVEVTITAPLFLSSMSLMVQYFDGYGESLIDYNVKQRKIGIGLNFSR